MNRNPLTAQQEANDAATKATINERRSTRAAPAEPRSGDGVSMKRKRKRGDRRKPTSGVRQAEAMSPARPGPVRGTPVTSNRQLLDYIADRLGVDDPE